MEIQGVHINAHVVNDVFVLTASQLEGIIVAAMAKGVDVAKEEQVFLDSAELGELWGVKPRTVKKWRRSGHRKLGTLPFELTYKVQMTLSNAKKVKEEILKSKSIKR